MNLNNLLLSLQKLNIKTKQIDKVLKNEKIKSGAYVLNENNNTTFSFLEVEDEIKIIYLFINALYFSKGKPDELIKKTFEIINDIKSFLITMYDLSDENINIILNDIIKIIIDNQNNKHFKDNIKIDERCCIDLECQNGLILICFINNN